MKPYLFFFLSLFCLTSCNRPAVIKEAPDHSRKIAMPQLPGKVKFIKYSEVYDSVRLVALETRKESMIGRIDKILVNNNNYYILDQTESKAVFEFDSNGKFIRKFGSVGTGQGQYKQPNDISFSGDNLAIWDGERNKFIIYTPGGKFVKEIYSDSEAKSAVAIDKDNFALYLDIGGDVKTDEKFNLKLLNTEGKTTAVSFEKKNKEFSKGSFFLSQAGPETLVSPEYSNDIYTIANNIITKKYSIDFGKYKIPAGFSDQFPSPVKFEKGLAASDYAMLSGYFESPGYLSFSFVYHGMIYYGIYSKTTGTLKFGNAWFNNVGGIVPGVNKTISGNLVIAYAESTVIESYKKTYPSYPLDQNKINENIANINRYFAGSTGKTGVVTSDDFRFRQTDISRLQAIKNTDNPVLLVQRLKSF